MLAAILLILVVLALTPMAALAWSGVGHFITEQVGFTASGYTVQPNFRQATTMTGAANSIISTADSADLFVNFIQDTTNKNIYLVYTTDGTAPQKTNGSVINGTFANYSDPNRTWKATIPPQAAGTVVNYVFYISDSSLALGWGRVSGTTGNRADSQFQTSWSEADNAYFTYTVRGASNSTSQIGKVRTGFAWVATPNPTYGTVGHFNLTFSFTNNTNKTLRNVYYEVLSVTKSVLMNPTDGTPGGVGEKITVPNTSLPGGDSLYQHGEVLTGQLYQVGVTGSGWVMNIGIFGVENAARGGAQLLDVVEIDGSQLPEFNRQLFLPVVQRR